MPCRKVQVKRCAPLIWWKHRKSENWGFNTCNQGLKLKDSCMKHYLYGYVIARTTPFYSLQVVSYMYLLINYNVFTLQILTDFLVWSMIIIFRETGLHTRSIAKKRQSRELVMMCIQTARLQQLSSSTNYCLVIYRTLVNFLDLFCFCLIAAFFSMNQYLRICHLFKVISVIHSVYLY